MKFASCHYVAEQLPADVVRNYLTYLIIAAVEKANVYAK